MASIFRSLLWRPLAPAVAMSAGSLFFFVDGGARCEGKSTTSLPTYTRREVATHTTASAGGIWVTYKDGVYDITDFLDDHPGGK